MLTRRAALIGATALPALAPAMPAGAIGQIDQSSDDPAVAAYRVWREADEAFVAYIHAADRPDGDPEQERLHSAEWEARKALAETVATTPAGIACQLRLAVDTFGNREPGGETGNIDHYSFGSWKDDLDGSLIENLLTAAARLAGRAGA